MKFMAPRRCDETSNTENNGAILNRRESLVPADGDTQADACSNISVNQPLAFHKLTHADLESSSSTTFSCRSIDNSFAFPMTHNPETTVAGWMKDGRVYLYPRNSLSFYAHTLIISKQVTVDLLSRSVSSWMVFQWPESIHVHDGEPVVLRCSFTLPVSPPSAASFLWSWKDVIIYEFMNIEGAKENNITHLGDPRVSLKTDLSGRSLLTIDDVTPEDSALYICAVTIHSPLPIISRRGNGTLVKVKKSSITGLVAKGLTSPLTLQNYSTSKAVLLGMRTLGNCPVCSPVCP
ncbi:unnamed protein product [Ranitomeya imitator]|uniref:Ig-like domain-containing protein n=1 Tax=Ranitomeya imitator TaxID=111125 RepID=A0ABN9MS42_9NEOB|nr:unnamed protein product [Ranitomeya imitator]